MKISKSQILAILDDNRLRDSQKADRILSKDYDIQKVEGKINEYRQRIQMLRDEIVQIEQQITKLQNNCDHQSINGTCTICGYSNG
jgi:predicted RNase H-like nuclease (RuvC/YqgF family)